MSYEAQDHADQTPRSVESPGAEDNRIDWDQISCSKSRKSSSFLVEDSVFSNEQDSEYRIEEGSEYIIDECMRLAGYPNSVQGSGFDLAGFSQRTTMIPPKIIPHSPKPSTITEGILDVEGSSSEITNPHFENLIESSLQAGVLLWSPCRGTGESHMAHLSADSATCEEAATNGAVDSPHIFMVSRDTAARAALQKGADSHVHLDGPAVELSAREGRITCSAREIPCNITDPSESAATPLALKQPSQSAAHLTLEDIRVLEKRHPLAAAAAALGVSPAELRRACRRLGIPRWRHRAHAAAAAALAAPELRTVVYAASLRRRYRSGGAAAAAGPAGDDCHQDRDSEGGGRYSRGSRPDASEYECLPPTPPDLHPEPENARERGVSEV